MKTSATFVKIAKTQHFPLQQFLKKLTQF